MVFINRWLITFSSLLLTDAAAPYTKSIAQFGSKMLVIIIRTPINYLIHRHQKK
jgi:hypothetical protein